MRKFYVTEICVPHMDCGYLLTFDFRKKKDRDTLHETQCENGRGNRF